MSLLIFYPSVLGEHGGDWGHRRRWRCADRLRYSVLYTSRTARRIPSVVLLISRNNRDLSAPWQAVGGGRAQDEGLSGTLFRNQGRLREIVHPGGNLASPERGIRCQLQAPAECAVGLGAALSALVSPAGGVQIACFLRIWNTRTKCMESPVGPASLQPCQ